MHAIVSDYNYWIYILLMMIGLYAMLAKNNLIKKIIGMSIFQTAIIVFYVSTGAKEHASIPIIAHGHGGHGAVREACELLLEAQGQLAALLRSYSK